MIQASLVDIPLILNTTTMMRTSRHPQTMNRFTRKKILWTAAAAAFSTTLPLTATAFVIKPAGSSRSLSRTTIDQPRPLVNAALPALKIDGQTRLYASSRRDDGDDGILSLIKKGVKKILPSSWFQSEEEKKSAIERKRVQDEVKGGLQEMFKDAPLPVRMMGNLIAPLFSSAMSGLAETMAQQQKEVDQVLDEAKSYLVADPAVAQLLGDGIIQVGKPFSQSSSSSSINGRTTSRVELAFPVQGSLLSGVAKATSANGSLQQLILQAGGRSIAVSLASKTPRPSAFRKGRISNNDDIIEAEIIEKDVKRN